MRKWLLILFLLGPIPSLLLATPDTLTTAPTENDSFWDIRFRNWAHEWGIAGMGYAYLVGSNGKGSGGVGTIQRGATLPVDAQTRFRGASLGKPFVALAILHMVQRGHFTLQSPVQELLPNLKLHNRWESVNPLTLGHLLEHTGGVHGERFSEFYASKREATRTMLDNVGKARIVLDFEPGTCTRYSNMGYALLGAIIEQFSGQRFEDYIRDSVLVPLSMHRSSFERQPEDPISGARPDISVSRETDNLAYFLRPSLEFRTTAKDMLAFLEWLAADGEIQGRPFLQDTLWYRFTHSLTSLPCQAGFGQGHTSGLEVSKIWGITVWQHSGFAVGYQSILMYFPQYRRGFVLLSNTHYSHSDHLPLIWSQLLPSEGFSQPNISGSSGPPPPPGHYRLLNVRNSDFELAAYLLGGVWVEPTTQKIQIRQSDGALAVFDPVGNGLWWYRGKKVEHWAKWGQLPDGSAWLQSDENFYVQGSRFWPQFWRILLGFVVFISFVLALLGTVYMIRGWWKGRWNFQFFPFWMQSLCVVLITLNILRFDLFMGGEWNLITGSLWLGSLLVGLAALAMWWQVVFARWRYTHMRWLALGWTLITSAAIGLLAYFGMVPIQFF